MEEVKEEVKSRFEARFQDPNQIRPIFDGIVFNKLSLEESLNI